MASLKYIKAIKRWRVWWHITLPSGDVDKGSKTFTRRPLAEQFKLDCELKAKKLKASWSINLPLDLAVSRWFFHIGQHTPSTQYAYKKSLTRFVQSLPQEVAGTEQVAPHHITRFLDDLLASGLKAVTCNYYRAAIKSFFSFVEDNYGVKNPTLKIKKRKEAKPQVRFLTRQEYQKMVEAAEEPFRQWVIFLSNTGLRATEFCELAWDCVNSEMTAITIVGKGGKQRTIPLNAACREILKKLPRTNPIFMSKNNKPLTRQDLYYQIYTASKRAGLNQCGAHALRHYFATELLKSGVPIIKVSILLGHASITTTQSRYSHILPSDLSNVTDVLL